MAFDDDFGPTRVDPEEQKAIDYWSSALIQASEAGNMQQLENVMNRMPAEYRNEIIQASQQLAGDDVIEEGLQTAALDRGPGTDDNPEGRVSGFGDAGTEMTIHANIGDPFITWRPEDVVSVMDRFSLYLRAFGQTITKKMWQRAVLPPLRHTLGTLFQTEGVQSWAPESWEWKVHKLNPPTEAMTIGGTKKSRQKQLSGGHRVLDYRGRYRRTLTTANLLNEGGNVFEPAAPVGDTASAGTSRWSYGFYYGIDQGWFTRQSRMERGDDFEAAYPSGFETEQKKEFYYLPVLTKAAQKKAKDGTLSIHTYRDYVKNVRRVFLTSNDAQKLQAQGLHFHDDIEVMPSEQAERILDELWHKRHMVGGIKHSIGDVVERPLWAIFRTEQPPIVKFKTRVRDNLIKEIAKYLNNGQKVHWYGARDSEGKLITFGDRHLFQLDARGTENYLFSGITNVPVSLRGAFRAASTSMEKREIEDMMFQFRDLRAKERTKEGITTGQRSDMMYLEHMLKNIRDSGAQMDDSFDDVPF